MSEGAKKNRPQCHLAHLAKFSLILRSMIRVAILASANGTNAQAIIEAVRAGNLDADVKVVLTNKVDAGVIERARKLGIPVEIIPSKGIRNRAEYDALVVEAL